MWRCCCSFSSCSASPSWRSAIARFIGKKEMSPESLRPSGSLVATKLSQPLRSVLGVLRRCTSSAR